MHFGIGATAATSAADWARAALASGLSSAGSLASQAETPTAKTSPGHDAPTQSKTASFSTLSNRKQASLASVIFLSVLAIQWEQQHNLPLKSPLEHVRILRPAILCFHRVSRNRVTAGTMLEKRKENEVSNV
ncbi:hypothetical protein RB195_014873 [Necator americanus]|uniref:Uncharacterized protein n=1 Tax=Necator americanus TaxID=51031 RepID=A0ABR1E1Y7_NECAM